MSVLDWIYPPRCMACRNPLPLNDRRQRARWLCGPCETLLEQLKPPFCKRCGHPVAEEDTPCPSCRGRTPVYTYNRSVYAYEGLIRELFHEMKFRYKKHFAAGMGELLADACAVSDFDGVFSLVPVPMFHRKKRRRGFNQAEVLSNALTRRFGVPTAADLLIRVRETPPQSGLSPRRREENMAGAFRLNEAFDVKDRFFYLIDDIHTTGASLNECARILLEGGAAGIACITFAMAVKDKSK